ncbi:hypothetical protein HWI79_3600 [Cryptosporidium felis]|nr:hypothetical protein HWI79_3600 [Cryptosporidium felis]
MGASGEAPGTAKDGGEEGRGKEEEREDEAEKKRRARQGRKGGRGEEEKEGKARKKGRTRQGRRKLGASCSREARESNSPPSSGRISTNIFGVLGLYPGHLRGRELRRLQLVGGPEPALAPGGLVQLVGDAEANLLSVEGDQLEVPLPHLDFEVEVLDVVHGSHQLASVARVYQPDGVGEPDRGLRNGGPREEKVACGSSLVGVGRGLESELDERRLSGLDHLVLDYEQIQSRVPVVERLVASVELLRHRRERQQGKAHDCKNGAWKLFP